MPKDIPTVAIMYGFAEGGWHSRKLRHSLSEAGFTTTKDLHAADIIIAHSGACYLVPSDARATLVMHVGYTYWPGRSLRSSLSNMIAYDRRQHGTVRWLGRSLVHFFYMLNIAHTLRMVPGWRSPQRGLDTLPDTQHTFVRNRHDSYCNADALVAATGRKHALISMPGGHMHLWDDPQPYVNLLQSVYG